MPAEVTAYWQNASERWAQRRSAELGIAYTPLWKLTPHLAQPTTPEQDEVILQWAEMNPFERELWGGKYPELLAIPEDMLARERNRLEQMRKTEREMRAGRAKQEPPPFEPAPGEFRLTSAAEVAEAKKRKKRRAS